MQIHQQKMQEIRHLRGAADKDEVPRCNLRQQRAHAAPVAAALEVNRVHRRAHCHQRLRGHHLHIARQLAPNMFLQHRAAPRTLCP